MGPASVESFLEHFLSGGGSQKWSPEPRQESVLLRCILNMLPDRSSNISDYDEDVEDVVRSGGDANNDDGDGNGDVDDDDAHEDEKEC